MPKGLGDYRIVAMAIGFAGNISKFTAGALGLTVTGHAAFKYTGKAIFEYKKEVEKTRMIEETKRADILSNKEKTRMIEETKREDILSNKEIQLAKLRMEEGRKAQQEQLLAAIKHFCGNGGKKEKRKKDASGSKVPPKGNAANKRDESKKEENLAKPNKDEKCQVPKPGVGGSKPPDIPERDEKYFDSVD